MNAVYARRVDKHHTFQTSEYVKGAMTIPFGRLKKAEKHRKR